MDSVEPLRALEAALSEGRSTFAWALAYAREGDPLPELWSRCDDPHLMLGLAARVHNAHASEALKQAALDPRTYPHARDCLLTAARYLAGGSLRDAESWMTSAVVHYPGRGTARPQPEKGRALCDALCQALRGRVALTLDALDGTR
jgi:hypothetical protein